MTSRSAKVLLFTGFLAVLVALVALSTWASVRAGRLSTVTAVQAGAGRVLVGVGGEVFMADRDGHTLGVFRDRDGRPWRTGIVSSVFREADGRYLVGEFAVPEIAEFDVGGHLLRRLRLPFVPPARVEVATLGTHVWVSDFLGNRVALLDRDGRLLGRREVGYPHGASPIETPAGPAVAFVSTLHNHVYALDAHLRQVDVPLVDQINRLDEENLGEWETTWGPRAMVYLWMSRDARQALVTLARGEGGDAIFVSVTADGRYRVLGDTDVIRPAADLDPDDMMVDSAIETPGGRVLAPSPRAATLLSFMAPGGRPRPSATPAASPRSPPRPGPFATCSRGSTGPTAPASPTSATRGCAPATTPPPPRWPTTGT